MQLKRVSGQQIHSPIQTPSIVTHNQDNILTIEDMAMTQDFETLLVEKFSYKCVDKL
jgi:hypothetical protein